MTLFLAACRLLRWMCSIVFAVAVGFLAIYALLIVAAYVVLLLA